MHRLSYLATLALILFAASRGIAATGADSTASLSPGADSTASLSPGADSTASLLFSSVPIEEFTLHLERGVDRTAVYVEPRADGTVAITNPDGRVEYILLNRIRKIEDSDGVDRTFEVTQGQHRLGTPVPSPPPPLGTWKPFRLRAGSPTECGSYLITDFTLIWSVTHREYLSRDKQLLGTVDLGYARSLGLSQSVGGSIFLGDDGIQTHAGLRLHLHIWPDPNRSLDIAPGIVLLADNDYLAGFVAPGFSGQAGMTFGGRFGFVAQVLAVRWRGNYRYAPTTDTAFHLGFRLGGEPGIVGGAAFMATEVLLAGTNRNVFSPFTP
jgi:hypothetical protein